MFIGKLDAIRAGDTVATAQFLQTVEPKVAQDYLRDLIASSKMAAGKAVKVNVNLPLARQALGIDPATFGKFKDTQQKDVAYW